MSTLKAESKAPFSLQQWCIVSGPDVDIIWRSFSNGGSSYTGSGRW